MRIHYRLKCEWGNCTEEVRCQSGKRFEDHLGFFSRHCETHVQAQFSAAASPSVTEFDCQWRDCDAQLEAADSQGLAAQAAYHVTQHAHHVIIKYLGGELIRRKRWPACSLTSTFSNSIAEQSGIEAAPLRCEWAACEFCTSNAYKYYQHCSEHRFEYERSQKELRLSAVRRERRDGASAAAAMSMPCLWRGCSQVCQTISNLAEHIRSHTKEKAVACPTCGQTFHNNSKFQNHLLRQGAASATHRCNHCHKMFNSQRILSDHMRRHVNTRKCPQCDFTLPTPSALKRHLVMRHSDEKPFVCTEPDCGHSCKTEDQLKVHKRRHDRSLQCYYCGQHFVTTHFLSRHLSTEHGQHSFNQPAERVYVCHLCQLMTKDSRVMSRHLIRRHRLARPPGFSKFRFELGRDGFCRVAQTRLETIEVTKQLLGTEEVECQLREQQQQEEQEQHQMRQPFLYPEPASSIIEEGDGQQECRADCDASAEDFRQHHDDYLLPLPMSGAASPKGDEQQVLDLSGL